jgi:hypothetical protein
MYLASAGQGPFGAKTFDIKNQFDLNGSFAQHVEGPTTMNPRLS